MASPELNTAIETLKSLQESQATTPQEMRAEFEKMATPAPPDIKCEPVSVAGVGGEWISALDASTDHAVLYLHVGGYVVGSIKRIVI